MATTCCCGSRHSAKVKRQQTKQTRTERSVGEATDQRQRKTNSRGADKNSNGNKKKEQRREVSTVEKLLRKTKGREQRLLSLLLPPLTPFLLSSNVCSLCSTHVPSLLCLLRSSSIGGTRRSFLDSRLSGIYLVAYRISFTDPLSLVLP